MPRRFNFCDVLGCMGNMYHYVTRAQLRRFMNIYPVFFAPQLEYLTAPIPTGHVALLASSAMRLSFVSRKKNKFEKHF